MMAIRQQQHHQGNMAGTPSPFLQWSMPERGEAILQDFMDQQTNNSQALVPAQMTRYWNSVISTWVFGE
jgi:hypothetical protein